jgi:hypothetical protein
LKSEPSPVQSRYQPTPASTPIGATSYPASAGTSPYSPSSTPYSASSTPYTPPVAQTGSKPLGLDSSTSGRSRSDMALQWVKANRRSALIAGLAVLGVLIVLGLLLRRRRKVTRAKRPAVPLTKPKQTATPAPDPLRAESQGAEIPVSSPNAAAGNANSTTGQVAAANASLRTSIQGREESGAVVKEPVLARSAAVANSPGQPSGSTKSSIGASTDEEQEREVFEL